MPLSHSSVETADTTRASARDATRLHREVQTVLAAADQEVASSFMREEEEEEVVVVWCHPMPVPSSAEQAGATSR